MNLCFWAFTVRELGRRGVPLPLIGEAQWAYHSPAPTTAEDYQVLKEEILTQCCLSACQAAAAFHGWNYDASLTPRTHLDSLFCTTRQWLRVLSFSSAASATQVMEWVAMDQFL